MYLASFDTDWHQILQGCVRFPCLPLVSSAAEDNWQREFERLLLRADSVEDVTASLRILSRRGGALERTLIISAPAREEADLRRYLASFTRLDNIIEGSVALPLTREEHDVMVGAFLRYCCRVAAHGYAYGEVSFACDFRAAPLLSDLLAEADALGYDFGYQVHVQRLAVDPGCIREARKNALRVSDLKGVPEEVALLQQRLADGLADATAVCEEFLAADTPEACEWLRKAVRRHFRRQFATLKFDIPEFEFSEGVYDEILGAALHSGTFLGLSPDEICCSAVDDGGAAGLLGWHPPANLLRQSVRRMPAPQLTQCHSPEPEEERRTPHLHPALPAPYEGNELFIFVSYRHQDVGRIAPVLHHLIQGGYNIWYDRGIPGGAEWDAVIEQKLTDCFLVLLFVSQSSIESKYVRREAKFADALNKPIVSVKLEEANLTYGMGMLLTQYQMISSSDGDFHSQLGKAIQFSQHRRLPN